MGAHLLLYILKRILVMLPTLFVIALICFLVLNLAPGKPGQAGEAAQASGSEEARAQYRIFKETFNYDKPVLLNTYLWLEEDDVRDLMDVASDPASPPRDKIEALNQLEDYGAYIVPTLLRIMDDADPDADAEALRAARLSSASEDELAALRDRLRDRLALERLAIYQLSINGQLRNLFLGRESDIPDTLREQQREIGRHNQKVSRWKLKDVATDQLLELGPTWETYRQEVAALKTLWRDWFVEQRGRFELDTWDKVAVFLTDTRFYKYMGNLLQGDFGFTITKEPVLPEILKRVRYSFILSLLSILLVYFLSIPIGIFSAVRQNTVTDQAITIVLFVLYSLPTFFVGTLMVQYIPNGEAIPITDSFSLPNAFFTSGFETSRVANPNLTTGERLIDIALHLFLPVVCLTYGGLAALSRYARTGLLDVIRADYIRTARAKGLSEPVVILKHALRNGMIPILTILGTLLPVLFGGSIVIEYIFEIDGIGRYMLQAIHLRDYTVIMGVLLISAVMTLVGLLISDISYALVDPRITFD